MRFLNQSLSIKSLSALFVLVQFGFVALGVAAVRDARLKLGLSKPAEVRVTDLADRLGRIETAETAVSIAYANALKSEAQEKGRAAIIRVLRESQIREAAASVAQDLIVEKSKVSKSNDKKNVIIVGAGPIGLQLAAEMERLNPGVKIVIVDRAGKVGGNFAEHPDAITNTKLADVRVGEDPTFSTLKDPSNPKSDIDKKGVGDPNQVTSLMQIASGDFTSSRYQGFSDIVDPLAFNALATSTEFRLNTEFLGAEFNKDTKTWTARTSEGEISGDVIVYAGGLGKPKTEGITLRSVLPNATNFSVNFGNRQKVLASIQARLGINRSLTVIDAIELLRPEYRSNLEKIGNVNEIIATLNSLKVMTPDQYFQLRKQRPDLFAGKTIGIVGGGDLAKGEGDTAKIVAQNAAVIGYDSPKVNRNVRVAKINWYGVNVNGQEPTCENILAVTRERYSSTASLFKENLVKPTSGRVTLVSVELDGKVRVNGTSNEANDFVVIATGQSNPLESFAKSVGADKDKSQIVKAEAIAGEKPRAIAVKLGAESDELETLPVFALGAVVADEVQNALITDGFPESNRGIKQNAVGLRLNGINARVFAEVLVSKLDGDGKISSEQSKTDALSEALAPVSGNRTESLSLLDRDIKELNVKQIATEMSVAQAMAGWGTFNSFSCKISIKRPADSIRSAAGVLDFRFDFLPSTTGGTVPPEVIRKRISLMLAKSARKLLSDEENEVGLTFAIGKKSSEDAFFIEQQAITKYPKVIASSGVNRGFQLFTDVEGTIPFEYTLTRQGGSLSISEIRFKLRSNSTFEVAVDSNSPEGAALRSLGARLFSIGSIEDGKSVTIAGNTVVQSSTNGSKTAGELKDVSIKP